MIFLIGLSSVIIALNGLNNLKTCLFEALAHASCSRKQINCQRSRPNFYFDRSESSRARAERRQGAAVTFRIFRKASLSTVSDSIHVEFSSQRSWDQIR